MPILTDWVVPLDVDDVFAGQGADPMIIRRRSPHLIPIAERALGEAQLLIRNIVIYKVLDVQEISHNQLKLTDDHVLHGDFIVTHLGNAVCVYVGACTISEALELQSARTMKADPVYGMALDGAASSAIQKLSDAANDRFSAWAAEENLQTTIPLSPGMIGWTIKSGQQQIFDILADVSQAVRLTESSLMRPLKSLSFVIGIAPEVAFKGEPCQFCSRRGNCAFRKSRVGNRPCLP